VYENFLSAKGVSLDDLGLRDIALRCDDAIAAINFLRDEKVAILGGDVYFLREDRVELAYANWYVSKNSGESFEEFSLRSLKETEMYINGFPECGDKVPVFSFVLKMPG
jgi:hypothetical protein